MSSLSGNPFLNYILVTAVELPGYLVSWLAACCLPRRLSFISLTLLGALALLLIQITLSLQCEWVLWLNFIFIAFSVSECVNQICLMQHHRRRWRQKKGHKISTFLLAECGADSTLLLLFVNKVLTITWWGEGKAGTGNMPNTQNAGPSVNSVPSMLLIHLTTAHAPSHIQITCGQVCPFHLLGLVVPYQYSKLNWISQAMVSHHCTDFIQASLWVYIPKSFSHVSSAHNLDELANRTKSPQNLSWTCYI